MKYYTISVVYQAFYVIIPTISLIGNAIIVYVTIRSKSLRSNCNILIALNSAGDVLHSCSHYIMIISYNIVEDHHIYGRIFAFTCNYSHFSAHSSRL
ncbi:hypothetical protein KIN20_011542 [Parelaphostrongylus tenuis]|uniref:G-protein coupled receptors family 1 profile domain-containing protein n=1 Tax=Parelaphostrongylus tenuis TaxID=148309 RepID=A0AAD5MB14_PARTN|nr:hypothetical protein KIN20_011542 [Parelaphostrongylus tenuis]